MSNSLKQRKGTPVRVVAGKYAGCVCWLDKLNPKTRGIRRYVIVQEDSEGNQLKETYIEKYNLIEEESPRSYVEAAMIQYTDIEIEMEKLARMLVRVNVSEVTADFAAVFNEKLKRAKKYQTGKKKGFLHVSWSS